MCPFDKFITSHYIICYVRPKEKPKWNWNKIQFCSINGTNNTAFANYKIYTLYTIFVTHWPLVRYSQRMRNSTKILLGKVVFQQLHYVIRPQRIRQLIANCCTEEPRHHAIPVLVILVILDNVSIYLVVYSLHHNVLPTLQSIPLMTNGLLYPITQDSSCHGQHTMPRNPWSLPTTSSA